MSTTRRLPGSGHGSLYNEWRGFSVYSKVELPCRHQHCETTKLEVVQSSTSLNTMSTSALYQPHLDTRERSRVLGHPTSFHYFPRLPPELRLQIWELAIRPEGHGIHYFSFSRTRNKSHERELIHELSSLTLVDHDFLENDKRPCLSQHSHVGPMIRLCKKSEPAGSETAEYSWFKRNRSYSFWDAGLWSACRESRYVVLRYLELNKEMVEDACLALAHHHGEHIYLRVQSRNDLFCLKLDDLSNATSAEWKYLLSQFPIAWLRPLKDPGNQSDRHPWQPQHIAFEYHPHWFDSLPHNRLALENEWSPRLGERRNRLHHLADRPQPTPVLPAVRQGARLGVHRRGACLLRDDVRPGQVRGVHGAVIPERLRLLPPAGGREWPTWSAQASCAVTGIFVKHSF